MAISLNGLTNFHLPVFCSSTIYTQASRHFGTLVQVSSRRSPAAQRASRAHVQLCTTCRNLWTCSPRACWRGQDTSCEEPLLGFSPWVGKAWRGNKYSGVGSSVGKHTCQGSALHHHWHVARSRPRCILSLWTSLHQQGFCIFQHRSFNLTTDLGKTQAFTRNSRNR